ncbi:unnamed protein product [Colias eurytheme]|nr:unnamed protein product [Colias eurytheme]
MKQWQSTFCCVVILIWPGKDAKPDTVTEINTRLQGQHGLEIDSVTMSSSAVSVNTVREIYNGGTSTSVTETFKEMHSTLIPETRPQGSNEMTSEPPDLYPVVHAELPRGLAVYPLPLKNSDHEVMLNVTWQRPTGPPVRSYSLEVHSTKNTVDCRSNLCYEYNIPGEAVWSLVPSVVSPIAGGCAVRPGCSYRVRLIAHPWDGHTAANTNVQLDECVLGVCSCAHAPRLPVPQVSADMFSFMGELMVNVSWTLPAPNEPLRLPPRLRKQAYIISLGKQMVSDAHPAPWFANTITRREEAKGFVAVPEGVRWLILPINEKNIDRAVKPKRTLVLDVKLLARVSLIDERGCIGPAGNVTAYDPSKAKGSPFSSYMLWALYGGICVLAAGVILAFSAKAVKRITAIILREIRPAPAPSPLQTMSNRPIWFMRQ